MRQFTQQYQEWTNLSVDGVQHQGCPQALDLIPGSHNSLICRCDGTTKLGSHSARGIVLLNHEGEILLARGLQLAIIDDRLVVKLLVLGESMIWCLEHEFAKTIFEGDVKIVIGKIIQAETRDNWI
ncbi:unnamed protein product [Linum trigynum]